MGHQAEWVASVEESKRIYPQELARVENELLRSRRQALPTVPQDAPVMGLALSGGGLRSAIFCLGVLQALARVGLLKRFDYLSTVSGGSYIGSFLTAMYARDFPDKTPKSEIVDKLLGEEVVPDVAISPVGWLRQNGRYLAPLGGTDAFRAFAIGVRNWIALHAVILSALITLMLPLQAGMEALRSVWPVPAIAEIAVSPFCILFLAALGVAALFGAVFWLVDIAMQVLRVTLTVFAREWRTRLTGYMSGWLACSIWLLAWTLVDTLARFLYDGFAGEASLRNHWKSLGLALSGVGLVPLIRWALTRAMVARGLSTLWKAIPKFWLIWPVALMLWTLVLVMADMAALALLYSGDSIPEQAVPLRSVLGEPVLRVWLLLLTLQLLLALYQYFPNRSSPYSVYAERLTRTFTGASNPKRYQRGAAFITEPVDDDDVDFRQWCRTAAAGGPLHLINVTLNETASAFAQSLLRDRKGIGLALGPGGVSAGVDHHALHGSDARKWTLKPLPHPQPGPRQRSPERRFSLFGTDEFQPEDVTLGYWTAISGAALASGLGSYGGRAQSLLASFANLRLGYWWKASTVGCLERPSRWTALRRRLRPMQCYLADEVLGRFFGTHRRHWYLSDGGHFENTGALELIRRRLPYIVIVDAEASRESPTGNLGALVLKARQDYQADVAFDSPWLRSAFGRLDQLQPDDSGYCGWSAALGQVRYPDGLVSKLIYLRPLLNAADPADLQTYRRSNPEFPYQSTADQFFDEAQWEAYRKLGENVGRRVFGDCDATVGDPLAKLFAGVSWPV